MTVTVFLLCLAAGLCCGAADGILSPLRKRLPLVFTLGTDVLLALAAVLLYASVLYLYCDGRVFFYAVLSEAFGFVAASAAVRKLCAHFPRRSPRKK